MDRTTRTGFAEINGARLYYEVAGAGHPLVLLHAGVADQTMWDEVWPALVQHYRTIRYDYRGFGQSSMPAQPYSLIDDLYGLLRFLQIEQAHLIGVSIGGSTIIEFALVHPAMVSALIPVAAGLAGMPHSESESALFAAIEAAYDAKDLERVLELEMQVWLCGPGRPREAVPAALRDHFQRMERRNLENELAFSGEAPLQRLDPPALNRLSQIGVPTLVIAGDLDVPSVLETADRLEAEIPGARKVIIPNVAHMVPMEVPARFVTLVLDFLQDT